MRLAAIIAAGLLSRAANTGSVLIDKYLGDALYAAMVFEMIRLAKRPRPAWNAGLAMAAMIAIECFQLTGIPAELAASASLAMRVAGRLLGTQFSWLDIVAYAAGIGAMLLPCYIRPK